MSIYQFKTMMKKLNDSVGTPEQIRNSANFRVTLLLRDSLIKNNIWKEDADKIVTSMTIDVHDSFFANDEADYMEVIETYGKMLSMIFKEFGKEFGNHNSFNAAKAMSFTYNF